MKSIRISRYGGPEVLEWADGPEPTPGAGEVLIGHTAIGLNFIDTYQRSGLYPLTLPSGLGMEAAGVVEVLGAGVKGLAVGDRVAYCGPPAGAYAEKRVFPAQRVVKIPAAVDDRAAEADRGSRVAFADQGQLVVGRHPDVDGEESQQQDNGCREEAGEGHQIIDHRIEHGTSRKLSN